MKDDMKQIKENDFLEMILEERIDMLLGQKTPGDTIKVLEEAEAVVAGLPDEQREKIEGWLNLAMDMEAEDSRQVYLGGFADGVRLAGKIYLTGMDGMVSLEKWLEKMKS